MKTRSRSPNFKRIPNSSHEVITLLRETDLIKTIGKTITRCCYDHESIYEITYDLGSKYLVCHICCELEQFCFGIKEKVRIKN